MERQSPSNIHGRKFSRGLRPLILIPTVLCVGLFFGGSVAVMLIWTKGRFADDPLAGRWQVQAVSMLFRWLLIPSLGATILLGLLLFLQHPLAFWHMRWFKLKAAILLVAVPSLHFTMEPLLFKLKAAALAAPSSTVAQGELAAVSRQFSTGLVVVVIGTAILIVIGRYKPRLGQPYTRKITGDSSSSSPAA